MTSSAPSDLRPALDFAHMRLRQIKEALSYGDHARAARLVCETVDAPILTDALGLEREPSVEEPHYTPEEMRKESERLTTQRRSCVNRDYRDSLCSCPDCVDRELQAAMLRPGADAIERWEQVEAFYQRLRRMLDKSLHRLNEQHSDIEDAVSKALDDVVELAHSHGIDPDKSKRERP